MIKIHQQMQERQLQSKLILQVHDELVFDAHKNEVDELREIVIENMGNAIPMAVPLVVDSGLGAHWLEAH